MKKQKGKVKIRGLRLSVILILAVMLIALTINICNGNLFNTQTFSKREEVEKKAATEVPSKDTDEDSGKPLVIAVVSNSIVYDGGDGTWSIEDIRKNIQVKYLVSGHR